MAEFDPERDYDSKRVDGIVKRIHAELHGIGPELQGAVLADCVAIWLAGHQGSADAAKSVAELREVLLTQFIDVVRKLVPVNEAMMREAGVLGPTRQ